jgi:prepilin-type N-terminal cleavage/methylation domain-containing protein
MRAIENPRHKIENTPISDSGWKPAMRNQSKIQNRKSKIARGFTLVELLVVMTIIGILLAFILNAAMGAVRQAQERATQSLITKLEAGLNDRLDALLQTRPDYNMAHYYLAGVYVDNSGYPIAGGIQRAQVIAWYDYIKSEMPDVFFYQGDTNTDYPLNFAANPYPGTALATYGNYMLPLGHMVQGPLPPPALAPQPWAGYGDSHVDPNSGLLVSTNPNLGFVGSGIFGASYTAAAGIYKNLGYLPTGYDGIDNNGNGLVDELGEGVPASNQATFLANFKATHKHSTARAEMLYALLVEGRGPLGSVFNRDDFTDKEVQDTDNDGLPEFVDAWGKPLQFFRWPLLYNSDIQRGQIIVNSANYSQINTNGTFALGSLILPYLSVFEEREQDSLDLNQQLMAPAWWTNYNSNYPFTNLTVGASYNSVSPNTPPSSAVPAFEYFFHKLIEPLPNTGINTTFKTNYPQPWDRGIYYSRRAFYSKFLILSGGLDQQPGVFLYPDVGTPPSASQLLANENNALPFSVWDGVADFTSNALIQNSTISGVSSYDPNKPSSYDVQQAAQDDISNHNLQSVVGAGSS